MLATASTRIAIRVRDADACDGESGTLCSVDWLSYHRGREDPTPPLEAAVMPAWFDLLRGSERPEKVTAARLADSLAGVVQQNGTRLVDDLRNQVEPQRFESVDFGIECLLFAAFPFDLLVAGEFGQHAPAIRDQFYDDIFVIARNVGIDPASRQQFDAVVATRFSEYAAGLKSGTGNQNGLEYVSFLAARHILGKENAEAPAAMRLALEVSGVFKAFKGMSQWYEIEP